MIRSRTFISKSARRTWAPLLATMILSSASPGAEPEPTDFLSFAEGVVPVALGGMAPDLKVGMEMALAAVDGDPGMFVATPKPGGPETLITMTYRLPALTTFTEFGVPTVPETPSPSQTFFREVEIAGSDAGPDGPFTVLAAAVLQTPAGKGQITKLEAATSKPVRWVKLSLKGGIDVQREQTFFEFSEIVGWGTRDTVPMLDAFTGTWKGRGVLIELRQDGPNVSGCYDRAGDLAGSVSGNVLRATGKSRSGGIPSTFVLTVADDGSIMGVRSTNGGPFKLYVGPAAPGLPAECTDSPPPPPGCGAIVHGIRFGFDSAVITPDSAPVLDALFTGLKDAPATEIVIVGHTSSEGGEDYNRDLSRRRALAVIAALVARGIDKARLSAQGAGEYRPIADNGTEAGRSLNRRVEIECR